MHRHTVNSSSLLHCLNLPACPKPCLLYTELKMMYFLFMRHKLLICSFFFCSGVLRWICYFSLLGKNRLTNHLISSPFDSIMWVPGSAPKPAEVNEKIPLDLSDPWITNWMHGCTVCLAQPKCRAFLQGVGLAHTPLLLSLCYWSCISVVDQISPAIVLKPVLARKEPKQSKQKRTEIRVTARTKTKVQLLCISSSMFGISRFMKSIMVLSSKIVWKERALCYERGEKFCVTASSVRSKSYDDFPWPDDAGLVCSLASMAQVSAALQVLQRSFPFNFAVKNV